MIVTLVVTLIVRQVLTFEFLHFSYFNYKQMKEALRSKGEGQNPHEIAKRVFG